MALQIKKVLNNNVAVILSDKGLETVVMGSGIAFQKKTGDMIPDEKIEKVFTLTGKDTNSKFQELVTEVPMEHILVSEKIIRYAKSNLGKKLSDSIYLTLTDHISTAVQRYHDGIILKNALLWDIKQFYPDEYVIGYKAVGIVKADLGVEFLEDEAAFIALHFVNAQMNESMTLVHDMTKLIQEITNIVKYHFQIEYNTQALAHYRFINHLKFFAQRLFHHTAYEDDDDTSILDMLREKNKKEYQCAQSIAHFVKQQYGHQMGNEEMTYITVHIARIVKESRKNKENKIE